jgi:outer membrane protein assembly factor BamB
MLWHYDGLGRGFSSVSIDGERLFVTGEIDEKGFLFVLGMDGKLLHKVEYGLEFVNSHPGARNTVIPDDGKLYVVSGMMELFCYDMQSLKLLWKKNYAEDFEAENTLHGWHGTPLIVGEKLIVAPGGKKHNVVALNKTSGELIWTSEGKGVTSGYGSPIYIIDQQMPQVVIMMSDYIISLDASNGQLLWSLEHSNRWRENPITPLYNNNMLLCTSSYGVGGLMLRLTDGGRNVSKVWQAAELTHQTGHVVKLGDYVYGAGERMYWYCVDWLTGKIMYADRTLAVGNIIAADGMLYCYSDKGEMALVNPNPQKFEIVSKFSITMGTEHHWAHPVIYQGMMYVRHGDSLMAYKLIQ